VTEAQVNGTERSELPRWGLEEGDEIVPGRFAIGGLGASDAFETYLAWDDRLAFLVVAKLLRPHLVGEARPLASLANEADLLERLAHPVLVRGFGAVLEGPRPHLVLEHLEGPHLSRLLRVHGPLPAEQLFPLAMDLCSALHYLAGEDVVHLDVKPRNVIMGVPPRLIDLSIAHSVEQARHIRGLFGTDPYMAPEQCDPGRAPIGPPTDVWGLGATLYHAVAGAVPFPREEGFDPNDTLARFPQLDGWPLPLPDEVPAGLSEIIFQCLEEEPADRPTAGDVALAFEPFVTALPDHVTLRMLRPRVR